MTPKDFETNLDRLADILAMSAGVQDGTYVLLHYFSEAAELMRRVAYCCRLRGASHVETVCLDHHVIHAQLQANPDAMDFIFDAGETAAWAKVIEEQGTVIQLRTDPDVAHLANVQETYGRWKEQMWQARSTFKQDGIERGDVAWTLFYVPTEAGARLAFPEKFENALDAYWEAIFAATYADQLDYVQLIERNAETLKRRCKELNQRQIKTLRFTGDGTDLTVGLSKRAKWSSASKAATGNAADYCMNVPSYEVYTTPDWRTLAGTVRITKTVILDGTPIRGAALTFKDGRVVDCSAVEGEQALRNLLDRDEGARQVGEVALVGLDSPIAKLGRVFCSLLLDENAACHIALGFAYLNCIEGEVTAADKQALGINDSRVHNDVMISDASTTVSATTWDGEEIILMEGGRWTEAFL